MGDGIYEPYRRREPVYGRIGRGTGAAKDQRARIRKNSAISGFPDWPQATDKVSSTSPSLDHAGVKPNDLLKVQEQGRLHRLLRQPLHGLAESLVDHGNRLVEFDRLFMCA